MGQMDRWEEEYQRLKGQREQSPSGVDVDIDQLTAKDIEMLRTISELRRKNLERLGAAAEKPREQIAQDLREQYLGGSKNPIKNFFKRLAWETGGGQQALQRSDKYYKENQDNFRFAKDDNADLIRMLATISKRDKDLKDNLNTQNKNITSVMKENAMDQYRKKVLTQGDERLNQGQQKIDIMSDPAKYLSPQVRDGAMLSRMLQPEAQAADSYAQQNRNMEMIRKGLLQPSLQKQQFNSSSPVVIRGYDQNNNASAQVVGQTNRTSERMTRGPSQLQQMLGGQGGEGILNLERIKQMLGSGLGGQQGGQTQPQQTTPQQPQPGQVPQPQRPMVQPQAQVRQNVPPNVQRPNIREAVSDVTGNKYAAERLQGRRYVIEDAPKDPSIMRSGLTTTKNNEDKSIRSKVRVDAQDLTQLIADNYVKGVTRLAHGSGNNKLTALSKAANIFKSAAGIGQGGGFFGQLGGQNSTDNDPSFDWDRYFSDYKGSDKEVQNYRIAFNQYVKRLGFDETKQATGLAALESERKGLQSMLGNLVDQEDVAMLTMIAHSIRLNAENLLREKGYSDEQILGFMGRLNSRETKIDGKTGIEYVDVTNPNFNKENDPLTYKMRQIYERLNRARTAKQNGEEIKASDMLNAKDLNPEEIFGEMTLGRNMDPRTLPIKIVDIRAGKDPNTITDKEERRKKLEEMYYKRGGGK